MSNEGYNGETGIKKAVPKRLLIIEDDAALSEILANIFNDMGLYCSFKMDAPNINAIEQFKPDLIVIDYHLPKLNGGEICKAVKHNRNLCSVPVMVISAYSEIILSLDGSLFDSFIEKPFDMDEISTAVKRLLNFEKVRT